MASSKIILPFFFITFLCYATSEAQPTYLSHVCSSNKTFTANSAFQSNLNTVLSSLSSANADFYNTTAAGGGDTAYGLFMCRGDVTLDVCHQCVVEATQRLTSDCQFSKEAVIWYDECMLRYSNTSFFSTVDTRPRLGLLNSGKIANPGSFMNRKDSAWRWRHGPPIHRDQMAGEIKRRCPVQKEAIIWYDVCMLRYSNQSFNRIVPSNDHSNKEEVAPENKERFNEVLSRLLNSVAAKVLKSPTKFATEQVNFTRTETLYVLEQCTPDLTAFDCNTCLRSAIAAVPNCCEGKRGATVLLPACNIRYGFYQFFKPTPPVPVAHSRP